MKATLASLCVAAALSFSIPIGAQTPSPPCNRDCLKQHLDTYLNAVTSHKPEAGQLWAGFRQTENAVVVPEGQGVWKSVTGLGATQRRYFDPVQSQAAYYGTVMMGQEEAVVALRLKVQWNQATEAEWFIARKG